MHLIEEGIETLPFEFYLSVIKVQLFMSKQVTRFTISCPSIRTTGVN